MGSLSTLALIVLSGVVTAICMLVVIRFDVAARTGRLRFELQVRRGAARLVQEADSARRTRS